MSTEFSARTRHTSWNLLKKRPNSPIDVVVIGGGIVGAGILRELALQGITDVYLFERGDFGAETSGASSKLIHAGIRYLEQAWLRLKHGDLLGAWKGFLYVWSASIERKRLGRMAPGLVKPKKVHFIVGRSDKRSLSSVALGVWIYYLMQFFQGQRFEAPRLFWNSRKISREVSGVSPSAVKGVVTFWDSETDDTRLVIENLQSANELGARALNYVEVKGAAIEGGFHRLRLFNRHEEDEIEISAKVVVNATGPWIDEVRPLITAASERTRLVDRVAGAHLDVYPAISNQSMYITASDGRLVFVLRRDEDGLVYSRIGTTERPLSDHESSDGVKISEMEEIYLETLVRSFFPQAQMSASRILRRDEAIRPLKSQTTKNAFQKSREHALVWEGSVVHVVGVKLTDFRKVAEELVASTNWGAFDITRGPTRSSAETPLRTDGSKLYLEKTVSEFAERTMILHWDDYVRRRRGLWPLVWEKTNRQKLDEDFKVLAGILCWDPARQRAEKARLS